MGKASRRPREKTGKTLPSKSPTLNVLYADVPQAAKSEKATGGERTEKTVIEETTSLPPKHPGWQSHPEAWQFFESLGWTQAKLIPDYSPGDVARELAKKMNQPHLKVEDRTALVPLGPNASHAELPAELTTMMLECEAHPERVYTILRTGHNTPAFLGGVWYWFVSERGGEAAARKHLASMGNPTAGMIVVNADGFNLIPTHVLQGGLLLGAGMTAALLNDNPLMFLCCVCNRPFVQDDEQGRGLLTAFGGPCGHPYHAQCLIDHFKRVGNHCHICSGELPASLVPERVRDEVERVCASQLKRVLL